ncbi:M56 family metallopeptidase [Rubritalea marina]|uniref:M56 family metallopeptidase n=1 Tax=Rubritalea marina TaxID=361055 RepID=UPI0003603D74|nr:M56 family metallopeptidase [Rubritalea marina]
MKPFEVLVEKTVADSVGQSAAVGEDLEVLQSTESPGFSAVTDSESVVNAEVPASESRVLIQQADAETQGVHGDHGDNELSTAEGTLGFDLLGNVRGWVQAHSLWIAVLWGLGVIVLALRWCFGAWELRALKRAAAPVSAEMQALLAKAQAGFYLKKVQLLESARVHSPMVVSWLKPVILVPVGMLNNLSPQQVEAILVHELAHIRRHDFFFNILQRAVETIFFFNPLVWVVGRELRQVREELCDAMAVERSEAPQVYAEALLKLGESQQKAFAMAAKTKGAPMLRRFQAMLNPKAQLRGFRLRATLGELALLVLVGALCFMPVAADLNEDLNPESLPEFVEIPAPHGKILDADGNPIAGAKVVLYYDNFKDAIPIDAGVVEEVTSAADGSYRFEGLMKFKYRERYKWLDNYNVLATHSDWAVGCAKVKNPSFDVGMRTQGSSQELDVYLDQPMSHQFIVKTKGFTDPDGNTLEPRALAGAKIYLRYLQDYPAKLENMSSDYSKSDFRGSVDMGICVGITDENGECSIDNLPPAKCGFMIEHSETSLARDWKWIGVKANDTTYCYPRASLSGSLHDEAGQPLANVTLKAQATDYASVNWFATTDENGRYEFPALYGKNQNGTSGKSKSKGEWKITLHHSSKLLLDGEYTFKLKPTEQKQGCDLVAIQGVPLRVQVLRKDNGQPYAFGEVQAGYHPNDQYKYTDAHGRVEFRMHPRTMARCAARPKPSECWISERVSHSKGKYSALTISTPRTAKGRSIELWVEPQAMEGMTGELVLPDQISKFDGTVHVKALTNDRVVISTDYLHAVVEDAQFTAKLPSAVQCSVFAKSKDGKWSSAPTIVDSKHMQLELKEVSLQKIKVLLNGKACEVKELNCSMILHGHLIDRTEFKASIDGLFEIPVVDGCDYQVRIKDATGKDWVKDFSADTSELIELDLGQPLTECYGLNGNEVKIVDWYYSTIVDLATGQGMIDHSNENGARDVAYFSVNPETGLRFDRERLQTFRYGGRVANPENSGLEIFGKTSEGGIFHFVNSLEEPQVFRATYEEFITNSLHGISEWPEKVEKHWIHLKIVDGQGQPIEGARIAGRKDEIPSFLHEYHLHQRFESTEQYQEVVTRNIVDHRKVSDTDGLVSFDNIHGLGEFRVDAPGYATRLLPKRYLENGALIVQLDNSSRCKGTLLKADGSPAKFHPYVLEYKMATEGGLRRGPYFRDKMGVTGITDEYGNFEHLVEPGAWTLEASMSDEHIIRHSFIVEHGETVSLRPSLKQASQLKVTFKDIQTMEPIVGLPMKLRFWIGTFEHSAIAGWDGDNKNNILHTDENGQISITGLLPNRYNIRPIVGNSPAWLDSDTHFQCYQSAYFAEIPISKHTNTGDLANLNFCLKKTTFEKVILLEKGAQVSGVVTVPDGVKHSSLAIGYIADTKQWNYRSILVKEDGKFSGFLPKLVGQSVQVCAYESTNSWKKTLAATFSKPFTPKPGEVYEFKLKMTSGGTVKGRVVDQQGSPVQSARIRYKNLDGLDETSGLVWAEPNEKGEFIMYGVPTGEFELQVSYSKSNAMRQNGTEFFTIREGKTTEVPDIVMEKVKK